MSVTNGYFVDAAGNYYEGDRAHSKDTEVRQRPGPEYKWNFDFGVWELDAEKAAEASAAVQLKIDYTAIATDPDIAAFQALTQDQIADFIAKADITKVVTMLAKVVRLLAIKGLAP